MNTAGDVAYKRLVTILRRSETWFEDLTCDGPSDTKPVYAILNIVRNGDQADIVVVFESEPGFECRIRVPLCDENGHPQYWTVAGNYLQEFLLTREYLQPELAIESGPRHLVVDGSESIC